MRDIEPGQVVGQWSPPDSVSCCKRGLGARVSVNGRGDGSYRSFHMSRDGWLALTLLRPLLRLPSHFLRSYGCQPCQGGSAAPRCSSSPRLHTALAL